MKFKPLIMSAFALTLGFPTLASNNEPKSLIQALPQAQELSIEKSKAKRYKINSLEVITAIKKEALALYGFKDSPNIAGNHPMYDENGIIYMVKPIKRWGYFDFKVTTSKGNNLKGFHIDNISVMEDDDGNTTVYNVKLAANDQPAFIRMSFLPTLKLSIHDGSEIMEFEQVDESGELKARASKDVDEGDEILKI